MDLSTSTVLVTGGASGIGLALAERFSSAGSEVILCGRREDKLREAKSRNPRFHTRVCDVSQPDERSRLVAWTAQTFPRWNVLVNNAGIQRRVLLSEAEAWEETRQEIAINFEAPIHLSRLAIPHFERAKAPAIINVTSGLAFVPLTVVPIYSATKAAFHSFTLSLREQLAATGIRVVEMIPPAVQTDLGGPGLHDFGVPLAEFSDSVFSRLIRDELEIPYGTAERSSRASRDELDQVFIQMNRRAN